MAAFLRDVRFAWRGLRRTPGFTLAVVLTLGLALGANTAIFSMVHALVLRPLPFPHSEQLVRLYCSPPEQSSVSPSPPETAAWAEETGAFSGVVGFHYTSVNRTGGELPERLAAVRTTPNLLSTVGVAPIAGRSFEPEDAQPGAAPTALISHGLATRLFSTSEAAPGQMLWLDGTAVRVVGVMPAGFALGDTTRQLDVWLPLLLDTSQEAQGSHYLTVIARLKPGVSQESARLAAARRSALLNSPAADSNPQPPHSVQALSWQEAITGDVRPIVFALWGAAAFVLLIACANVANLLLARAVHRRREGAIRSALGAGLGDRMREALAESGLLALMGGALGLLLALWGTDLLTTLLPASLRSVAPPQLHLPVLLFAAGLCLSVAGLLGLVPAIDSSRAGLLPLLAGGHGSTGARHPLRAALVVVQLALALVLLTGAGLLVRTLAHLSEVELGFHPEGVVSAAVQLPAQRYPDEATRARAAARLEEALSAIPGVQSAGLQREIHLGGSTTSSSITVEGTPDSGPPRYAENRIASPGSFDALGETLKRGRFFTATDTQGALPVALVNETFVRTFLADREPLGARCNFGGEIWWTVVGVVGDVRHRELTEAPAPAFYVPVAQQAPPQLYLIVRGTPAPTLAQLREAVRSVDPDLPVPALERLDALVARGRQRHELLLTLLSSLSGLALLLAALGIWGVMSYSVTQRMRELSIRRALGATEGSLVRLVVGAAGRLVGLALLVGLPAAVGLGQAVRSLLYGVTPADVPTLLGVAALLGTVGLLAAWLPARRAAKVDPGLSLRAE
jgi:putative ABC transport system permease protein